MFRISLVNMPFSSVEIPSIALTQLSAVVAQRFGPRVAVEIHYLSHDVCRELGSGDYRHVCDEASLSGLGDWLFRQIAFPEVPDNEVEYQRRYFPAHDERRATFERVAARRPDLDRLLDRLIDRHGLDRVDLVGFTSMFTQNVASFALARKLKSRRGDLVIAMGGANCESPMGEEIARHVPAVDYVFSGPALLSFPELVAGCLEGDPARVASRNGVLTRDRYDLRSDLKARAPLGDELDINAEIPLDYGSFLASFERVFPPAGARGEAEIEPILLFETSRGCWWGERAHCTFCGLNGSTMSYRSMDPDRAIALIESLFPHYPRVRQLNCVDNILPKSYPREVFARLETPPGLSIFYEVKADLKDEEIALLARAGVDAVQPGIEALATKTLTLMRKGMTAAGNIVFLQSCLRHDVQPAWNLLVGFPGETKEIYARYLEDLPRIAHLPPPSGVHLVRFDRFSPYFTQARQYGLDLTPLDFYAKTYPFPPESLANLAYYFADRNVTAPYFVDAALWITRLRKAVAAWRDPWMAGAPPVLCFDPLEGTTIRDTRSGRPVLHQVGATGRQLLIALAEPLALADLARRVDLPEAVLTAELARLDERGLLFEDRNRRVSLVLPQAPAAEKIRSRYLAREAVPA
ncbi:MAG TPA: RiPP maturation radical SAM C-methyltransferase [Thermoanaerobaculia bacterium]|nr:RiPP maturation radical SAM C-methyltransferase [Thermoanaerobaculia bacterium]